MQRACVTLTLFLASISTATAADVRVVDLGTRASCNIRLTKVVSAGDLKRLKQALQQVDRALSRQLADAPLAEVWGGRNPTVCLNSPGGNYAEALKIAEFLLKDEARPPEAGWIGVTTYVERGAECLSACALIFMAGKFVDRGGETTPNRILHVGGRLGFHAPYVDPTLLDDKSYSRDELAAAHAAATVAISSAIKLFNYSINEGAATGVAKPWVKPSLFAEMLSQSAQELYLIDTVFKAGRWGVDLQGFAGRVRLDARGMQTACENFRAWEADWESPSSGKQWEQTDFERTGEEQTSAGGATVFTARYNQGVQKCLVTPITESPWEGASARNPVVGFYISLIPGSEAGSGVHRPLWQAASPETRLGNGR